MRLLLGCFIGLLLCAGFAAAGELDGKWSFIFDTEMGERRATFDLKSNGAAVEGKVLPPEVAEAEEGIPVKGTFEAGKLVLTFPFYSEDAGFEAELRITGKLAEDKLSGDWEFDQHFGTFTASRQ